jgi:hypothetical protein
MDAKNRKEVEDYFDLIPFTDYGVWNMYRTMFSVNSESKANYVCLMIYKTQEGKF